MGFFSSTSTLMAAANPIVSRVTVQGRYLVDEESGERFLMRGIDESIGTSIIDLYNHLINESSIPLFFSESGCCSIIAELIHHYRDNNNNNNGLLLLLVSNNKGTHHRDWKQIIPVMDSTKMSDEFSGFIAYYDGPPAFSMTTQGDGGGPWDGIHTETFAKDMENFRNKVQEEEEEEPQGNNNASYSSTPIAPSKPPSCDYVDARLYGCCELALLRIDVIPSYDVNGPHFQNGTKTTVFGEDGTPSMNFDSPLQILVVAVMLVVFMLPYICKKLAAWRETVVAPSITTNNLDAGRSFARNYDTFSQQA